MTYNVVVSNRAKEHLHNIKDYITNELKAPQSARNVLNDLEEAMKSLCALPERIPFSRVKELRLRGVHWPLQKKTPPRNFARRPYFFHIVL